MTAAPTVAALDGADPLAHAHTYAALGWRVVPILPGQKRPALDRWTERATTDPALIEEWWTANPGHGVGIATGEGSGIFALDVDPAHGGDDTLADLEASYGPLPATVEAITGGGGRHLLFRWPELGDGRRLGNSAGKLGPGLDIRGDGGQIVVAPTMHPTSGRRYQWELSSRPGEIEVADAPGWLLALLTEDHTPLPEGQLATRPYDDRFAWDSLNAQGNAVAVAMLEQVGWKRSDKRPDEDGTVYMTRPGKGVREGTSASIGKISPGVTMVFTSEAPPLEAERAYNPAELYAALHHGGDRRAADAALVQQTGRAPTYAMDPAAIAAWVAGEHARAIALGLAPGNGNGNGNGDGDGEVPVGPQPIDWTAFWAREHIGEDWLVQPILPRGRQVALWARHKTGKSLITLEVAAALATGQPCLLQAAVDPVDVIYFDMEMTEDDLHERLTDLGYGPEDDLSRLHYYLLPSLPPLDTERGGATVVALARHHGAEAVVIDTMARVVAGDENDADTYRNFYRHTGLELKAMGVSVLRLDHGGKDPTKGQRGSSGKGDDVDVVWQLKPAEQGLELKRDVSRMSWVPESVSLLRTEGPLRHMVTSGGLYPAGTSEVAAAMQRAGVNPGMSQNAAIKAFREAGGEGSSDVMRAAFRYLKELATREMKEMSEGRPWDA